MSTPTVTPRTDNAWRRYNRADLPDPKELVKESSALETELAAAKAECARLQALGSWAHTCIHHTDEQRSRAERCSVCATAELAAAKECVAIANRSADDQMHQKREAQTELARIRAEVEALKQSIESGQRVLREDAERNAARAERAEAELAARDAEYMRGGKMLAESAAGWQARAERAEGALAGIACQKTHKELAKDETQEVADTADYQGAYDQIIAEARAAIDAATKEDSR